MKFDELRNQPILLFPTPKNDVYFADKDHVWINGRQYISLKRVGEMMKEKRMTNADRIRAMTDEELAEWIATIADCGECKIYSYKDGCMASDETCACQWLDWLKQEATE